jgi:hypothetical protein
MSCAAHEKLLYAQALLGHSVPSGDLAQVFERALDALIPRLERAKFGGTRKPRANRQGPSRDSRHLPAEVKRAVWERDQGRCTFVSETGRRCEARQPLEFDHVLTFARGGDASVSGIRLRCRAHNQYLAERTYGPEFMRHKRARAQARQAAARATAAAARKAAEERAAAERAKALDVVPWLRQLGFRADEARRAAAHCEDMPDATLEERVRRALSCVVVRGARVTPGMRCPSA